MKKIFNLIISIPKDKLLHLLAGMIISLISMFITGIFIDNIYLIRIIGVSSSILIGVSREMQSQLPIPL